MTMKTLWMVSLLGAFGCAGRSVTEGRYDVEVTNLISDCPASLQLDQPMVWDVYPAAHDTVDLRVYPHDVRLVGGSGRDGTNAYGTGSTLDLTSDAVWSVQLVQEDDAIGSNVEVEITPRADDGVTCSASFWASGPRER